MVTGILPQLCLVGREGVIVDKSLSGLPPDAYSIKGGCWLGTVAHASNPSTLGGQGG